MTTYRWKPGASVKIDAQTAGEELERIRIRHNGRLTQEIVLNEAQKKGSPLHKHFDWSDALAAKRWRLDQAAYLIRSIEVFVTSARKKEPVAIRAMVNVIREDDRSYTSVQDALADPELRAQVVAQAWRELEQWRKRHAELVEFAKVFVVIDKAQAAKETA